MPGNASAQSSKRRKGGPSWQNHQKNKVIIESGDWGAFVTCDMGREGKCIPEAIDLFTQSVGEPENGDSDGASSDEDGDIEAQIRKEVEAMKPGSKKTPQFQAIRTDMPCVSFIRFDKSIDPEKLVHDICVDAYENPDRKRTRFLQRITPIRSIRKTLSVDLEDFAREILKPHFHSGGGPKKYAIRPSIRGGSKFKRDEVIQTIAQIVGPEHPVDLKNYDLAILVEVAQVSALRFSTTISLYFTVLKLTVVLQNVIGMSVVGSDYEKLKRYNIAELYNPGEKPRPSDSEKPSE
ncbi:hypothetical protein FE257_005070 [Aspergillus nanangensis]|uniref:THUMP domain-containing protein n=1 Tax=Aspergillus nanangensis TaxID=2582783 RepID=A0AAD4GUY6_ASPNN|nr:hypothetical protein FE257_005070 [Aspergillus nanangensis]